MNISEIIFAICLITLLVGFLSMLFLYLKLLKRLNLEEHELKKHYLKKAKTEANQIVEEAGQEALSMLSSSRVVSEKDQAVLETVIKQIVSEQSEFLKQNMFKLMQEFNTQLQQIKAYNIDTLNTASKDIRSTTTSQVEQYSKVVEQVKSSIDQLTQQFTTQLQQLKTYDINAITNVSKDIVSDTSAQVDEYKKVLEQQTINSEKAVSKKIDDEYKVVEAEIKAYKDEQFKRIEAGLNSLLIKIATEVLEKSFNPQEHKDLIVQSLENAKNENVFEN